MQKRSREEKKEILARIKAFTYCGFSVKITGNIAYHYQSFVGRDFKAWLQMAVFIVEPFVSESEKQCWLHLAKVNTYMYMYIMYGLRFIIVTLTGNSNCLLPPSKEKFLC